MSTSPMLQRGRACITCRRRKMKCDGRRPICGPCQRSNRGQDCEYADQGISRTLQLEETIVRLQSRIQELENPAASSPSVQLFDPYKSVGSTSAEASGSSFPSPISPLSPSPTRHPSERENVSHLDDLGINYEPSSTTIIQLIDVFMCHAHSYGFFLNSTQFRTAALLRLPLGNELRPSRKLMHAVYLLAACHSALNETRSLEAIFLECALQNTPVLSTTSPKSILHTIQAEILLANYFFNQNRLAQGRIHQQIARSLCVSYGLYKIRSASQSEHGLYLPLLRDCGPELPSPESSIDEGERINAFWTVYILDRCWGAVLPYPDAIGLADEIIDTPWPFDMWQYEQGLLDPALRGHATPVYILSEGSGLPMAHTSVITLHAQAAVLLYYVSSLRISWLSDVSQYRKDAIFTQLLHAGNTLDTLYLSLPMIPAWSSDITSVERLHSLLVIHSIVFLAQMYRLEVLASTEYRYANERLQAATIVSHSLREFRYDQLGSVDPILAVTWGYAYNVLYEKLEEIRLRPGQQDTSGHEWNIMIAAANRILSVMRAACTDSGLMRSQYLKFQSTRYSGSA